MSDFNVSMKSWTVTQFFCSRPALSEWRNHATSAASFVYFHFFPVIRSASQKKLHRVFFQFLIRSSISLDFDSKLNMCQGRHKLTMFRRTDTFSFRSQCTIVSVAPLETFHASRQGARRSWQGRSSVSRWSAGREARCSLRICKSFRCRRLGRKW